MMYTSSVHERALFAKVVQKAYWKSTSPTIASLLLSMATAPVVASVHWENRVKTVCPSWHNASGPAALDARGWAGAVRVAGRIGVCAAGAGRVQRVRLLPRASAC